jgi:type VI secretion system protein ImpG
MRDELLLYYERELDYLRKSAAQFAEKHPKVASRLVLEPTKCEDPHVERLLEAFAFWRRASISNSKTSFLKLPKPC